MNMYVEIWKCGHVWSESEFEFNSKMTKRLLRIGPAIREAYTKNRDAYTKYRENMQIVCYKAQENPGSVPVPCLAPCPKSKSKRSKRIHLRH